MDDRTGAECLVAGRVGGQTGAECLVAGRVGGQTGAESLAVGQVGGQNKANGLAGEWEPCWGRGDHDAPPEPGPGRRRQGKRPVLPHKRWLGLKGQ